MQLLNTSDLSRSFVNASRKETSTLPLPDLDAVDWESIDFLGWTDPKNPSRAFVVVPVDGTPRGVILKAVPSKVPTSMCAWCEDIKNTSDVKMFSAKRSGAAGRQGNTVGTLLHADFSCSEHVRRPPSSLEGTDVDHEAFAARRIDNLRDHIEGFVQAVMRT